jgi:hypothetical protein
MGEGGKNNLTPAFCAVPALNVWFGVLLGSPIKTTAATTGEKTQTLSNVIFSSKIS